MKNLSHMNISCSYNFVSYVFKACSKLATLLSNYFLEVKREHQPEWTSYIGNVLSNNGTFKDKLSPLIHQRRGTGEEMNVYGTKEKDGSSQLSGVNKQTKIQNKQTNKKNEPSLSNICATSWCHLAVVEAAGYNARVSSWWTR